MTDEALPELLAAGREGGPSPRGAFQSRVPPGARHRIELWRANGMSIGSLEGRWLRTVSIAYSSTERWIAAGGFAGGVAVWETATGALVSLFPDLEADAGADGRLPLLFAGGDSVLVCGGRSLTFIDTTLWKTARAIEQPTAALRASADPLRIAAYEAGDNKCTRWTLNVKSMEIEGADLLRETRVYRALFAGRRAS